MNSIKNPSRTSLLGSILKPAAIIALVGLIFLAALLILWLSQSAGGVPITGLLASLFGMDTVQSWWYVTRAAGLTAYFLLWLSMVWGMGISTKIFHSAVDGTYTYDFHEFLSLLGLGFVILHVVVLMLDQYLPFSIAQVLIPFIDPYRPLWVGLGIIGFYLLLLVTVTFYIRSQIGTQAFRSIHVISLLGYLGATLHGLYAGTDSALPVTKLLYIGTLLVVVFLTVYWLVLGALTKTERTLMRPAKKPTRQQEHHRLRPSQR
jgi:predicted ferric reductase